MSDLKSMYSERERERERIDLVAKHKKLEPGGFKSLELCHLITVSP